jgi:hypothetical protein
MKTSRHLSLAMQMHHSPTPGLHISPGNRTSIARYRQELAALVQLNKYAIYG